MAQVVITESIDLEKMLAKLPVEVRQKGLTKAVKQGGAIVRNEAKKRAPVENPDIKNPERPHLKDSIIAVPKKYKGGTIVMVVVGPSRQDAPHGQLLEAGHRVVPRGPAGSRQRGKTDPVKSGLSFVPEKKWFAPAVDVSQQRVDKKVVDAIAESIKKAGG